MLTGRRAKAQTGHSDFAVKDEEWLWYFLSGTSEVGLQLYETSGSHLYMQSARKKVIRKTALYENMEVSPTFVLEDHKDVQRACGKWPGEHCILIHGYHLLKGPVLLDEIAFAYEDSSARGSKSAAVIL